MMEPTVMPCGKHKGELIEDIPSVYLKWVAEYFDDNLICEAADAELRFRAKHNAHIN